MSSASDAAAPSVAGTVFEDDTPEVTRSYAEAIVTAAGREGQLEAVIEDLEAIASDVFRAQPRFAALLGSPLVSAADKDRILVEVFQEKALPTVVRFLRVLNRHGRLGALPAIAREARALWDKQQNRRSVIVRSAVALDGEQRVALRDRLARMLAATPVVHHEVDPSLIGGLVVQVGDDVYDASVRNRLGRLRDRLIERKSHEIPSR